MTDELGLLSAALAGQYDIERAVGAGGMATVYLAQDVKHQRKVAIKVLKPELAAALGADRFLAEIKLTARLQHPHILPLFDSGTAESFLYFVTPYVEGGSLRDRLDREKLLPIEEAVRIATEVAEGLEYAHRRDVIHRDIKPANILLHEGQALIADFGIGLAISAAGGARLTKTGLSIGTPQYMSPEHAAGDRPLDGRSDVYSLACVLYEMLTGQPPHSAATAVAVFAKILVDDPRPAQELRATTPDNVAAALQAALAKEPADRIPSAGALAGALADPSWSDEALPQDSSGHRGRSVSWAAVGAAAAAAALAVVATTTWIVGMQEGSGPATYDVGLPAEAPLNRESWTQLDISPDGDFVVYVASTDSVPELWYRSLLDGETRALSGSEGAMMLAVSPDGDKVAFITSEGIAKVLAVDGGVAAVIAELDRARGLQWTSDETLLLADGGRVKLVGAQGDGPREYTASCPLPSQVSNGERIVCGGGDARQWAVVRDLSDSSSVVLRPELPTGDRARSLTGDDFRVVDRRFLTFMSPGGDLRAAPFDPVSLVVGRPTTVLTGVRREAFTGAGQYAISESGTLVFAEGANGESGRFVRTQEDGRIVPLPIEPNTFWRFDVSPDGTRLAAVMAGVNEQELRIYNLEAGSSRVWLTDDFIGEPLWTLDSRTLLVSSGSLLDTDGTGWTSFMGRPDESSEPERTFEDLHTLQMLTYHSDSLIVALTHVGLQTAVRIDLLSDPPTVDTLVAGVSFPELSRDARWLAYQSGRRIFLRPYSDLGSRYAIDRPDDNAGAGWGEPQWLPSGDLTFFGCCYSWYRVQVTSDPVDPLGQRQVLHVDPRFLDTAGRSYRIMPDGGLLYLQRPEPSPTTYLRVIPGWVEQMERAVEAANR